VSNDDGVLSAGLEALAVAMATLGEVWVVAPEVEQSAASHAISLHRPLRIRKLKEHWYSVDGTPTDCAYLAIHHLMKDELPRIAVAGINHGPNLADDVIYSGTVAAAMEASLLGVPAIAFSLVTRKHFDFAPAARFARSLVSAALSEELPPRVLLNVNVPEGALEGYAVTRLGRHSYGNAVVENVDPRGRRYYWIGGNAYQHEDIPGSDCNAVLDEKLASVTPMLLDLTDEALLQRLGRWKLEGFQCRPAEAR
jgi:5'-nucleotidase